MHAEAAGDVRARARARTVPAIPTDSYGFVRREIRVPAGDVLGSQPPAPSRRWVAGGAPALPARCTRSLDVKGLPEQVYASGQCVCVAVNSIRRDGDVRGLAELGSGGIMM